MARIVRWARRVIGAALIAWSAWQLLKQSADPLTVSRVGHGVGAHGETYELRVAPLSRSETAEARTRERELAPAWEAEP
jgi:hypothetical protein